MFRLISLYLLFAISITIGLTSETNQTINLINFKFKDCGPQNVVDVSIAECKEDPCTLVRGSSYVLSINYKTLKDYDKHTNAVSYTLNGKKQIIIENTSSLKLPKDHPIQAGFNPLIIPNVIPSMTTTFYFEVVDDVSRETIACANFPVIIK